MLWVLLRNYCGFRGGGEHSVVDSIEKLGDPRIARGGFKERIMEPVTTAPLAMADCISPGCLLVCLSNCQLVNSRKGVESQFATLKFQFQKPD